MKLTFINAGYGEAILIRLDRSDGSPFVAMIDGGGGRADEFENFPMRIRAWDYLKKHGVNHINLLVSTHTHEDHNCGLLDVVKNCEIDEFWCNVNFTEEQTSRQIACPTDASMSLVNFIASLNTHSEILRLLRGRKTVIKVVTGIQEGIVLAPGLSVDILGPNNQTSNHIHRSVDDIFCDLYGNDTIRRITKLDGELNLSSIMLRLHYKNRAVYLPGDVSRKGYGHLTERLDLLKADIMKIGHHGQKDALEDWQLEQILPSYIVTCASSDRRYNSANPEVYRNITEKLARHGIVPTFLFSDNVNVPFYSDGIPPHSAAVLKIDDKSGEITYTYEL